MYTKKISWLLCATILSSHAAFAEDAAQSTSEPAEAAAKAEAVTASGFTLNDAISKALLQSPRLKAFGSGVAAARGERQQAGLWYNPNIAADVENIGGSNSYKGISSAQTTFGVTQQFAIGGKLSAQRSIADRGLEIASLTEQAAALDIIRDITIAYADAIAAEENARLAREQRDLAGDVLKSVSIRVNAAAAPLIQKSRAEVERASATIALDKATREGEIARQKIAALMGDARFTLPIDKSYFYRTHKPEITGLDDKLKANPDMVRLGSNIEQSKARLELERANAIPDPQLNIGVRDLRDTGDRAFVVGVSLPIPVFNANGGNIERARSEVLRTEQDNRQFELNTNAELIQARERLQNTYIQAETLREEILPSASTAFRLAREGYNLGRFPYLEVLDAQRSLFGVKQQQIEAIRQFHTAKAQLERLTALHMNDIQQKGETHAE